VSQCHVCGCDRLLHDSWGCKTCGCKVSVIYLASQPSPESADVIERGNELVVAADRLAESHLRELVERSSSGDVPQAQLN